MRQGLFIPDKYKNDKTVWAREEKIKGLEKEGFEQIGIVFHELTLLVKIVKKIEKVIKKEVVEEIKVIKRVVKKVVNKKKVNKK